MEGNEATFAMSGRLRAAASGVGGALRRWLLQTKQSHNGNRTRGGAIANQRGRHAEAGADAETLRAHRRSEAFYPTDQQQDLHAKVI